mgnify:CR=1 FL=1
MKLQSSKRCEQGIYLPFLAIAMIALLFVVGFGIDTGKLFLEQLRVQRSADAGTVSGMLALESPLMPQPTEEQIKKISLAVTQDNFDLNRIKYDKSNPTSYIYPSVSLLTQEVSVQTESPAAHFVFGSWVRGSTYTTVHGSAAGVRVPVAISLILDITGSMNAPANPSCTGSCESKLDALKRAAVAFINRFDPSRDRISIVTFADQSKLLHSVGSPFSKDEMKAEVSSLTADGGTGIRGGLFAARADFSAQKNEIKHQNRFAVLITDGAPTVIDEQNPPVKYPIGCNPDRYVTPDTYGYNVRRKAQLEAIAEADALRSDGVMLFAIGIGPVDPDTSTPWQTVDDPWQIDPRDPNYVIRPGDFSIKNYALQAIVNDASAGMNNPSFPVECWRGYSDSSEQPAGELMISPNGSDLNRFLMRIASTILLRLTA